MAGRGDECLLLLSSFSFTVYGPRQGIVSAIVGTLSEEYLCCHHHQGVVDSVKLTTLTTFYFLVVERILLRALPAHGKKCCPQSFIPVLGILSLDFSSHCSVYSFLRIGQRLGKVVYTVNPSTGSL